MTPGDSKQWTNTNRVRMFGEEELVYTCTLLFTCLFVCLFVVVREGQVL